MSEPFEHYPAPLSDHSNDVPATPMDGALVTDNQANDGFDRERVLRLLDQLEQDITAVETAMVHAESGDHEAYAVAVSSLDPRLSD